MAVWLSLYDMPAPVIVILAVAAFTGLIWGWNGLAWRHIHLSEAIEAMSAQPTRAQRRSAKDGMNIGIGRDFFVGQWRCGKSGPTGEEFIFTLRDDGTINKDHVPNVRGTWTHEGNTARIQSDDGWRDVLRVTPEGVVIKCAYYEKRGPLPDSAPTNFSLATKL